MTSISSSTPTPPGPSLQWFWDRGYPDELIHAAEATPTATTATPPCPCPLSPPPVATDELCGLFYAYRMNPVRYGDMKPGSLQRNKEPSFAAKIDRPLISWDATGSGSAGRPHRQPDPLPGAPALTKLPAAAETDCQSPGSQACCGPRVASPPSARHVPPQNRRLGGTASSSEPWLRRRLQLPRAKFSYPDILDGAASGCCPAREAGRRAACAGPRVLPLLLPDAVGAFYACPASRPRMTLARRPGRGRPGDVPRPHAVAEHLRALAEGYAPATPSAQAGIAAVFHGLNLYLGNYIGNSGRNDARGLLLPFGLALLAERRFPGWLGGHRILRAFCSAPFATSQTSCRHRQPQQQPPAALADVLESRCCATPTIPDARRARPGFARRAGAGPSSPCSSPDPTDRFRVSPICLGTMTFNPPVYEAAARRLVHQALDRGVNLFDTANIYEGYARVVGRRRGGNDPRPGAAAARAW